MVTMMTIGYGDIYPQTHFGRFVCILACLVGMLLVSTLVLALSSKLEFTADEARAYAKIKNLHSNDELRGKAARVIAAALLLRRESGLAERFAGRLLALRSIRALREENRSAHQRTVPPEQMLRSLNLKLKRDMQEINQLSLEAA